MGIFNKSKYIKFGDYTYAINLSKLREICSLASGDIGSKEIQLVQTYEMDELEGMNLSQKIEHETKSLGGNQNGMIYEILKLMIISILENNDNINDFEPTFGTTFAINTLIEWELLIKLD